MRNSEPTVAVISNSKPCRLLRVLPKKTLSLSIALPVIRLEGSFHGANRSANGGVEGLGKPVGDTTMRFMILVKASKDTEAGVMPSQELLAEMGKFNEELVKAGILLAGEGLQASSKGARVKFSGGQRTVIDGPFAETKELVAGYWLWQCKSKEEAIEWVKRCPNPTGADGVVEIRQVFSAEDFGPALTPELRKNEERLRTISAQQEKGAKR
jgi:hypothetical protein